eukprot:1190315-Prorocentrum_minimum.AAC.3
MLGAPIARGTNYIAQALVGRKPRSTKPFGRRLEVLAAAKKKSVKKPVDGDKAAEAEYAARTARRITGTTNGWSMRQQLNAVRQMKKVSVRSHLISFLHGRRQAEPAGTVRGRLQRDRLLAEAQKVLPGGRPRQRARAAAQRAGPIPALQGYGVDSCREYSRPQPMVLTRVGNIPGMQGG